MLQIKEIPIGKIKVGKHEQRMDKDDEDIDELAASISRIGVLMPLVVSGKKEPYTLVAGHRRLKAAGKAGLSVVPCIFKTGSFTRQSEVTFAENFFRKDLTAVELACALKEAVDNQGLTVEKLAQMLHKTAKWVRATMKIYNWPAEIQMAVHNGALTVNAAGNLAQIKDKTHREFLVRQAVALGATAVTTSAWLQEWNATQSLGELGAEQPGPGGRAAAPVVPKVPCFCCSEVFPTNQVSHIPVCGQCIKTMREAGLSQG